MYRFGKCFRLPRVSMGLPIGISMSIGVSSMYEQDQTALESSKAAVYNVGERQQHTMIVGNPDKFSKKWKKFSTDGIHKLLVIADFDYTLTPFLTEKGEQGPSSHGVLMRSPVLTQEFQERARHLFLTYYPIEVTTTLSQDEKIPFMEEWWTKSHDLLIEYKLTKQHIMDSVESSTFRFRPGFFEIFELLEKEKVPTLIFSAGLADVIRDMLIKEYKKTVSTKVPSNLHVISNLMHFNEKGEIKGFDGKMIHCFNKNASVLMDTPFWSQCQMEKRHNILLLGDSLGDASMANGLDYQEDEIIKIGFLNTKVNERLDEYLERFDVVLIGDASLYPVELLLHQIVQV